MAQKVPPPALADAIRKYLVSLEREQLKPATVAAYGGELARFRRFVERTHREGSVAEVDRTLVSRFQRSVSRARREGAGRARALQQATVRRRLVALRGFLRYAHREGWVAEDLASKIELDRVPERHPNPMREDRRLLLVSSLRATTLQDKRDKALILLLLSSGARISELLRLDRRHWTHNRLILRDGGRQRTALVTKRARAAVEDYLEARTKLGDVSPALFTSFHPGSVSSGHNRLTAAGARHICIRLAQRATIPQFSVRDLRDTVGCLIQERCEDPRLTADTLGFVGLASVAGYVSFAQNKPASARKAVEAAGL